MIAFIDSSVLLRQLFRERDPLAEWRTITAAYASRLLLVEVGRVIDRARLAGQLDDARVEKLRVELRQVLRSIDIVEMNERILERAGGPLATSIGTLDAIHLATALELAPGIEAPLVVATHDERLARAARASGLDVVGA